MFAMFGCRLWPQGLAMNGISWEAAPPTTRYTVLVVDDTPDALNTLGGILRPHYRVRVANSGNRVMEIAVSEPQPDLIILDVMMPGMDGYEVLTELRQHDVTARIPVIFVTALDSPQSEEKGFALGAADYITKPFRVPLLLARIRAQLEMKHQRDLLYRQNVLLEEQIARRTRENRIIQDVSILALANLAEARDPETGAHLRRTQAYVDILARKLAQSAKYRHILTPRYLSLLSMAAPLHDIGKVGIPDYVLLNPGSLGSDEQERIKQHCRIGAEAIETAMKSAYDRACWLSELGDAANEEAPLEFLKIAKEIALHHHERWDGAGYPDGLVGSTIPLSARLMAIADVLDSLVSWRVYRRSVEFSEAVRTIKAGRGSQFDPELVDLFLSEVDQFREVVSWHAKNSDGTSMPGNNGAQALR